MKAFLIVALLCAPAFGAAATMPVDTLRSRLIASVLPVSKEDRDRLVESANNAARWIRADGAWADVDYADQSRSHWRSRTHLERILQLAKAYRINGQNKQQLDLASNHWLEHDYRNPNWWWNEIGTPEMLGEALNLMAPDLTPQQLAGGLKI